MEAAPDLGAWEVWLLIGNLHVESPAVCASSLAGASDGINKHQSKATRRLAAGVFGFRSEKRQCLAYLR